VLTRYRQDGRHESRRGGYFEIHPDASRGEIEYEDRAESIGPSITGARLSRDAEGLLHVNLQSGAK